MYLFHFYHQCQLEMNSKFLRTLVNKENDIILLNIRIITLIPE